MVVLEVPVLVVRVVDQAVRVVLEQAATVVALADLAVAVQEVVLVVLVDLAVVVLAVAVLVVAEMDNAVHLRRSHVLVVAKTSMKCCRRRLRRIPRAMHQCPRALSLLSVDPLRKSLHQS